MPVMPAVAIPAVMDPAPWVHMTAVIQSQSSTPLSMLHGMCAASSLMYQQTFIYHAYVPASVQQEID